MRNRRELMKSSAAVAVLLAAGGWLPLHDGSPPAEIERALGMSKKAFKRGVGGLYKARKIAIEAGGIRLIERSTGHHV